MKKKHFHLLKEKMKQLVFKLQKWISRYDKKENHIRKYALYWGAFSSIVAVIGLIGVALWWSHVASGTKSTGIREIGATAPTIEQSKNDNKSGEDLGQNNIKAESLPAQGNSDSSDGEKTADDFAAPVKGSPVRDIGNYYSDILKGYLYHAGKDYIMPEGAVIRTIQGGKVIYAGEDLLLGQKVWLDCGQGWQVIYGGLDNLRVKTGDVVKVDDVLGQIGYEPGADGVNGKSQLHYEVWQGGIAVNFP